MNQLLLFIGIVMVFCVLTGHLTSRFAMPSLAIFIALGLPWLEGFLIGSVIASVDTASVFNILRSKKLDLKFHTASLLELESGSKGTVIEENDTLIVARF